MRKTLKPAAKALADGVVAQRSPLFVRLMGRFCARDLGSAFHRVRVLGEIPAIDGPMVIVANHPSWWDVELYAWLAATAFSARRCYAPMDTPNMTRYGILRYIGIFPVMQRAFSGAAAFLAVGQEVLSRPEGCLFVTAEGRFHDVRRRPVQPMSGLAHLARRVPDATFVPLAVDYVFWSERRPNLLFGFGEPISGTELAAMTPMEATARIGAALEACMSRVSDTGQSRNPAAFTTVLKGREGMNVAFDLWRRAQALLTGRPFAASHRVEP